MERLKYKREDNTTWLQAASIFSWSFGVFMLLSLFLLSGCKVKKVAVNTEVATKVEVETDTLHYIVSTSIIDTTYYVTTEKEKVRVEEYYDPETGKLRQRVTESERSMQAMMDRIMSMQATIDSLQSKTQTDFAQNITEEREEEAKPPASNRGMILPCLTLILVILYLIKRKFKH